MPIKVFNPSILDEMLEADEADQRRLNSRGGNRTGSLADMSMSNSNSMSLHDPAEAMAEKQRFRRDMREQEFQRGMEKLHKQVVRKIEEGKAKSDQKTHEMVSAYQSLEATFVKGCYEMVDHKATSERQKYKKLYEEWCTNVFDKIQGRVNRRVDKMAAKDIEDQKRHMFQEFLDTTNRKDGIYRDIIIESDYDPLAWRKETVTYGTGKINQDDPVKRELNAISQDRAGPGAPKGIPRHRSREVLDVKMWDKIEATPHGKAAEMFAAQTSGATKPTSKTQTLSVPRVSHYERPATHATATHELHGYYGTKGRKTVDNATDSFAID